MCFGLERRDMICFFLLNKNNKNKRPNVIIFSKILTDKYILSSENFSVEGIKNEIKNSKRIKII